MDIIFISRISIQKKYPKKIEKLKIALNYSQRNILTVAARAAPGDLSLKSHPKDYEWKLTLAY